jgi:hypothetical protein
VGKLLTAAQALALVDLSDLTKAASARQLATPTLVFRNLSKRGYAEYCGGSGLDATWKITPAGRAALQKENGDV